MDIGRSPEERDADTDVICTQIHLPTISNRSAASTAWPVDLWYFSTRAYGKGLLPQA
jgi:hypothetical protein